MRQRRKLEHVRCAVEIREEKPKAGFQDVFLVHQALPELSLDEVDPGCRFLGKELAAPVLINAMTGGHPELREINRCLARAAKEAGIAMAVGSQRAALEDPALRDTYTVARKENPDGVLLANLNAGCTPDEAVAAVEMLAADGLQLYLNAPQELAMTEGDVDFRGVFRNLARVKKKISVPLIVKEVGFGMSGEMVRRLGEIGVDYIDVGGWGGTNFIVLERMRGGKRLREEMDTWGIPTVVALVEANQICPGRVIASGGVRTSLDAVKALALGAQIVGIARPFLTAYTGGLEAVVKFARDLKEGIRSVMFLMGARDINTLRTKPVIITGRSREWLRERGVDSNVPAQRKEQSKNWLFSWLAKIGMYYPFGF